MTIGKGQGVHRPLWTKDVIPKKQNLAEKLAQQLESKKRLIERARQIANARAAKKISEEA